MAQTDLESILNPPVEGDSMGIQLYDSLTRKKKIVKPLVPGRVRMYTCGPTVYGPTHLGHIRTAIAYDALKEYLKFFKGFEVVHIQNITDVGHIVGDRDEGEDKVERAAKERKVHPMELVDTYIRDMWASFDAVKCSRPNIAPRATGHILEMLDWCKVLLDKGYAYEVEGDVYFDVTKFRGYGKLSGNQTQELGEGARIERNPKKRNPADFALWKRAEPTHIMQWTSPWGKGYPGWHIECSVMSTKYLGDTFDIHGGARELAFPHHENEIAQSEAYTGKPFVMHWVHTGLLLVNGEKMAKSAGNFITVQDALRKYSPDQIRWFMLSNHYASAVNFTDEAIEASNKSLARVNNFLFLVRKAQPSKSENRKISGLVKAFTEEFTKALDDDFNTPQALGAIHTLVSKVNPYIAASDIGKENVDSIISGFERINRVFKCFQYDEPSGHIDETEIRKLIEQRERARKEKNWAKSDRLRSDLELRGVELMDQRDGKTLWKKV